MIGGLPGVGPLISYPVSEAVIANPELEDAVGWILPFGVYEGQRSLSRFISASLPVTFLAVRSTSIK